MVQYNTQNRRMVEEMIRVAAIKKADGLEGVIDSYKAGNVEEERNPEIVGENPFSALLEEYKTFLEIKFEELPRWVIDGNEITEVLSPDQINAFLQSTVEFENHEHYKTKTGYFISALIQKSYNAGYNDFFLSTKMLSPVNELASLLQGTPENHIRVRIENEADNYRSGVGGEAKYIDVHARGGGNDFLFKAQYCTAVVEEVAYWVGENADSITIFLKKLEQGDIFTKAKNSTITIEEILNPEKICLSGKNCTYKALNEKAFEKLLPLVPYGNAVVYAPQNGREQKYTHSLKRAFARMKYKVDLFKRVYEENKKIGGIATEHGMVDRGTLAFFYYNTLYILKGWWGR